MMRFVCAAINSCQLLPERTCIFQKAYNAEDALWETRQSNYFPYQGLLVHKTNIPCLRLTKATLVHELRIKRMHKLIIPQVHAI